MGVPLLFSAGYYASGLMYVFYGAFTLVGFFVWWRVNSNQRKQATIETGFPDLHLKMGDDSK